MAKKLNRTQTTRTPGYLRTRNDHARELAEDYVELIGDLIEDAGEARAVDIARHLGVSHVTVTKTVGRLKRDGLVTSAPYRSVFLTAEGRKLAVECRNRHQLVLDFLLALGVPRNQAEIDAEGIEHHISPKTLSAMKRFLQSSTRRVAQDEEFFIASKSGRSFHRADCRWGKEIRDSSRIEFPSHEAAVQAGYTVCKRCNS